MDSDSDMEVPSWGNVVWFDQDVDEDGSLQWTKVPLETDNYDEEDEEGDGAIKCQTKVEHQSASKQYYEKYATNRIYRFEEEFQASTKHNSSTPKMEYDTFRPLDDEEINNDKTDNNRVEDVESSGEDELGNIFNLNVSRNNKTTIKGQRKKDLYYNLKNLQ